MRLRRPAALALTLLTGIGGHYVNRRPDRALFFGVVFLVLAFFGELFSPQDFGPWRQLVPVAIAWIISLGFTWRDARAAAPSPVQPSSWMGKVAALALTLFCAATIWLVAVLPPLDDLTTGYRTRNTFVHSFVPGGPGRYADVQRAWQAERTRQLELEFRYAGRPLPKLHFSITLDNRNWIGGLVTGADGIARVAMPPGRWRLTEIDTSDLEDRPGELSAAYGVLSLISGREPKLDNPRQPYSPAIVGGLPIDIPEAGQPARLTLTFVRGPELLWPPQERGFAVITADLNAEIRWEPVDQAKRYQVVLLGDQRPFAEKAPLRVAMVEAKTTLPLTALRPDDGAADTNYTVAVSAFSASGDFLGNAVSPTRFVLSGPFHFAPPALP